MVITYKFPTTHISPRLLYTTVAESCPGDDGNATAKDSNSHNLFSRSDDGGAIRRRFSSWVHRFGAGFWSGETRGLGGCV
jgi:hypothetical protein